MVRTLIVGVDENDESQICRIINGNLQVGIEDSISIGTSNLNVVNLNAVTTATNGASVATNEYVYKTIYVNVSINTGAVTVNIEHSNDGTNWWNYTSKTYTATTAKDSFAINDYFPYIRTTTSSHSSATVTTSITGRTL